MDLSDLTAAVLESEDSRTALDRLGAALAEPLALRSLLWLGGGGGAGLCWPEGSWPAEELRERLAAAPPGVLRIGEAEEALVLTAPDGSGRLVLLARAGAFANDPGWARLGAAFARLASWEHRARSAEAERDDMRQRAEESEALHVLGLAANRSLDPDEVLVLVARFTRTLLGAHFVTVSTSDGDRLQTAAAVGLRTADPPDDDPLARRAVEEGKPVTVGPGGQPLDRFPVYQAEGMQAGLGVPLALFGQTFGALVVGYRRSYEITTRDIRLALTLAGHAAVAISNARLHRALADRSRELERAYEELRWSSQAKERFFASMSHELRTPLNAILGYQSLLLDAVVGEISPAQRPFLENAHRATENLLFLVNDILDLSKLEAGKMELVVRPVELRAVVLDSVASVEPIAERKGIRLRVPEHYPPQPVETDADRVRQILINLLSNAVKYTESGEVTLSVACEPRGDEDRPAGWLRIQVIDTGNGIAEENLERIFHEFEQVVGVSSRGGTGLGLPISRKLARLLGGDLTVESRIGVGSTFTLHLPYPHLTVGGTEIAESLTHS